ncbi:MAG: alpha-D-ribose 1-methylphosphonate 5-triphosphate diphosphatase [Paracoccaceae bacterium]
MLSVDLKGADVLLPEGFTTDPVSICRGQIVEARQDRAIDLSGYRILPGIVDLHGDAFERHVAPRRGAMKEMVEGLRAAEAEVATNGVTTAYLAQFVSWEGGLRGLDFAGQVFTALRDLRGQVVTDLQGQLRMETHLIDHFNEVPRWMRDWGLSYIVFNDHLPHDRLAKGRKPPRLTGQALKAARNPDDHFTLLLGLHARSDKVPAALDALCAELRAEGLYIGSHDEATAEARATWRKRGAFISEFPETQDAAEAARANGDGIILGAPNVVRGGSHKGNASAFDLIAMDLCDALASDYHYPSLRRAAFMLERAGIMDLAAAWALISSGPARIMGLNDRGRLIAGLRADIAILDEKDRLAATLSGGQISYMNGDIANRFID